MSRFNTANKSVQKGLNALSLYEREYDEANQTFKEAPKKTWARDFADAWGYGAYMLTGNMRAMKEINRKKIHNAKIKNGTVIGPETICPEDSLSKLVDKYAKKQNGGPNNALPTGNF